MRALPTGASRIFPASGARIWQIAGVILVPHRPQNQGRTPPRSRRARRHHPRQGGGQALRAGGIVRSVQQNDLPAGALHPLQPPGPLHFLQSRPDGGVGDRDAFPQHARHRQRQGGVGPLVLAGEADFIIADFRIPLADDGQGRLAGAGGLGDDFQRGGVGGGGDDRECRA